MTDIAAARPRLPVTAMIGTSLFFTGITYASTLNYTAIVGIDTLGIPNGTYALLLMVASLASAAVSVAMGYASDRVPDRRLLVIGCALAGALAFGLIYVFRNQVAFIIAICVIMPVGHALFSQSMSFARVYLVARNASRADFMISVLRTIFAVAWAIVPPVVGWIAVVTSVFEVYGVAAVAYVAVAITFAVLMLDPRARIGIPPRAPGAATVKPAAMQVEPAIMAGIAGWVLIATAIGITGVTAPLLVTTTIGGSYSDLGLYAGLAAAIELPFMILWGYSLRWLKKHTVIILASVLYAVYLALLSRAGSVTDVLWLQLINGPATAALMSIPISYMQEAIRGRVGLSTSLLDVVRVAAALASAAIFGVVTATAPDYPLLFVLAAGLSGTGALVMFVAHRIFRTQHDA